MEEGFSLFPPSVWHFGSASYVIGILSIIFKKMPETCAKCRKDLDGVVVTAMDKKWHKECFACAGCGKSLQGQQFHKKDGAPYCIPCRVDKFDPTCAVSLTFDYI